MRICEHVDTHKKIFSTNLSAPFICEHFGDKLMKAMPYVDYLFGNESVSEEIFV
jgi:adenosine kinase